jgi:hypothetical protein
MLPNFLVIGAPKAGTTALAAYLAAHPQVFVAPEKEVHFFDTRFDRGLDWYRGRFADARGEIAVGEASPTYMYHDAALERIASVLPAVKLIAVLRNPVDRAYSHYWWMHALFESRSFEDVARQDMANETGIRPYVRGGRYLERLQMVRRICPDSPVHVTILEELRSSPAATYAEVCRFLGVEDSTVPQDVGDIHNPAYRLRFPWLRKLMFRFRARKRLPASLVDRIDMWNRMPFTYPPMDQGLREELEQYYAGPNAELAAWLGRDLPLWERSDG